MSIGDPTIFGNLPPPSGVQEEIARLLSEGKSNGYAHSMGVGAAREAVAASLSSPEFVVRADDVAITSGCSHAIMMAMDAVCREQGSVLVPSPGFSLYRTLCAYLNLKCTLYPLDASRNWEVNMDALEQVVTPDTRCIIVNNPSNPCGVSYSKEHLLQLLTFAEKHKLPIISDEVYAHMSFPGHEFHSMASLSTTVPILVCGGIAKRYMVPGWRVGWVVHCDRRNVFRNSGTLEALQRVSQTILGACTLMQAVVPYLLQRTPQSYHDRNMRVLMENAVAFVDGVKTAPGITAVMPSAAMYAMVKIEMEKFPKFPSEVEFAQGLLEEQQVFVLPGSCFTMPNSFRVVLCAPADVLADAAARIVKFCLQHYK